MKLKPAREATDVSYPEYNDYRTDRRRLLRLLAGGGAALSMGALLGCDQVREVLGLAPQHPPLAGTVAIPNPPVPPVGDDDDSADARPVAATRGEIAVPEAQTPPAVEEVVKETSGDPKSTGTSHPGGKTKGKIKSPSSPKPRK